jgi:RNA polymerase sigma-70 factor (ECF subfamily)
MKRLGRLGFSNGDDASTERADLEEMLDRIYESHVADVHRWVRRLTGPRQDVEDLVHEVFLVAMRRRGEFRGEGKVSTWLFRITALVVKDRRQRERSRHGLFARHSEDMGKAHPPVVTPLEDFERQEQVGRLYAALDRLPDRYRTPIILYELEGLATAEVAELLGVSSGALWVRLHRGRSRLLRELAKEDRT